MVGGPIERIALHRALSEDIPSRFVHVVDYEISDDRGAAVVLLVLNPDDDRFARLSFCEGYGGDWRELSQADAFGAASNWAAGRWVAYISGEAPTGASAVTVRHRCVTKQRPVVQGLFLAAFWPGSADPEASPPPPPELVAFGD